jgi:hypothetical protein
MMEKRKYTRVPFSGKGSITAKSREYPMELKDISLRGALVSGAFAPGLKLNEPVELDIRDESLRILVTGIPVSRNGDTIGLRWTGIGERSLNNLYLAVKKWAADKAGIDTEFRGMILKQVP